MSEAETGIFCLRVAAKGWPGHELSVADYNLQHTDSISHNLGQSDGVLRTAHVI